MHDSTMFGRALNPVEKQHSRYLDALTAFRTGSCLRMEDEPKPDPKPDDKPEPKPDPKPEPKPEPKGFPENTPVVEMTAPQQAAYYKHQAQKHEERNKALLAITGGKHGDDLKAVIEEHDKLKAATLTDSEKAIEDAKKQTRSETALETVRTAFELVLPDDMPEEKKTEALGVLNFAAFLTADGKVDTAKVKTHAATLAPAKDNGQQPRRDWGGGHRETGGAPLGAAGKAEAERRFPQKSTTTS